MSKQEFLKWLLDEQDKALKEGMKAREQGDFGLMDKLFAISQTYNQVYYKLSNIEFTIEK